MHAPAPTAAPLCPTCGRPMRLSRLVPRTITRAELTAFECRPCGVFLTEAVDANKPQ